MDTSILISLAIPVFFLMIGIELIYGYAVGNNNYRLNDSIAAISLGLISRLPPMLNLGVQGIVWSSIATNYNLALLPTDSWITWVVAFVLYDVCYYWMHRLSHEIKVLWATHVVHHQGEEFNLSTALRQSSSGWLWKWIFYTPMFFIGVPGEVFFTVAAVNLLYQFWVHTEHIRKLGVLEYVLVTPSNHRVHHAQNAEYIDANYGGVFILWDRVFGSFIEEKDELKPIYGTVKPLRSWNPIWSNLEIYHQMFRDSFHTKGIRNKIRVWFSGTGWRPDDVLEKFPHISNDLNNFEKYDPACDAIKKTYSLIQFVINSIISVVLIFTVSNQSYLVTFGIAVMLVFSTSLVNLILENKQWAINLEIVRALFVMTVYLLFAHKTSILTVEWFFYQAVFSFIYLAIFLPINKKSTYSSAE
ncbi:MAG: hypothetical protein CMO98_00705 [Woeseia sp.]|nr:hypothetical protein [Woeseia sp.]